MKSLGNYFPFRRDFLTKEVIFIAHFLINASQLRGNSSSTLGQLRVNSGSTPIKHLHAKAVSTYHTQSSSEPLFKFSNTEQRMAFTISSFDKKNSEPEFLLVSKIIVR